MRMKGLLHGVRSSVQAQQKKLSLWWQLGNSMNGCKCSCLEAPTLTHGHFCVRNSVLIHIFMYENMCVYRHMYYCVLAFVCMYVQHTHARAHKTNTHHTNTHKTSLSHVEVTMFQVWRASRVEQEGNSWKVWNTDGAWMAAQLRHPPTQWRELGNVCRARCCVLQRAGIPSMHEIEHVSVCACLHVFESLMRGYWGAHFISQPTFLC